MSEAIPALREYNGIISNSVTTVALPAIPVVAGDYIIACVMHRAALTVPSGWVLVESAGPVDGSGVSQWVSILSYSVSAAGSVTPSFTQAASGRMSAAAFRAQNVSSVTARADLRVTNASYSLPSAVTSAAKGTTRTVVWGIATILYATATSSQWAVSPGAIQPVMSGAASGNEARMGAFFDQVSESTAARVFTPPTASSSTTGLQLAAVELVGSTSGEPADPKRFLNVGGVATPIQ